MKKTAKYFLKIKKDINYSLAQYKNNFVCVSFGSTARKELTPSSDIDILILLDKLDTPNTKKVNKIISNIINNYKKITLDIQVISLKEVEDQYLMHGYLIYRLFINRYEFGEKEIYKKLAIWKKNNKQKLKDQLLFSMALYTLCPRYSFDEPKDFYLEWSSGGESLFRMIDVYEYLLTETSSLDTKQSFDKLKSKKIISENESKQLKESFDFFIKIRNTPIFTQDHLLKFIDFEKISKQYPSKNFFIDFIKSTSNTILIGEKISQNIFNNFSIDYLDRHLIPKMPVVKQKLNRYQEIFYLWLCKDQRYLEKTNLRTPEDSLFVIRISALINNPNTPPKKLSKVLKLIEQNYNMFEHFYLSKLLIHPNLKQTDKYKHKLKKIVLSMI